MRLEALRGRLAKLAREMPALASNTGGPARNAQRLASIEAAPEGAHRNVAVMLAVHAASGTEEPEDFAALVDAIGPGAIALALPAGLPTQPTADTRARARAWHAPAGETSSIVLALREQIAQEAVTP